MMKSENVVKNIEKISEGIGLILIIVGIVVTFIWGSWFVGVYVVPPLLEATIFRWFIFLWQLQASFAMMILGIIILLSGGLILKFPDFLRKRSTNKD